MQAYATTQSVTHIYPPVTDGKHPQMGLKGLLLRPMRFCFRLPQPSQLSAGEINALRQAVEYGPGMDAVPEKGEVFDNDLAVALKAALVYFQNVLHTSSKIEHLPELYNAALRYDPSSPAITALSLAEHLRPDKTRDKLLDIIYFLHDHRVEVGEFNFRFVANVDHGTGVVFVNVGLVVDRKDLQGAGINITTKDLKIIERGMGGDDWFVEDWEQPKINLFNNADSVGLCWLTFMLEERPEWGQTLIEVVEVQESTNLVEASRKRNKRNRSAFELLRAGPHLVLSGLENAVESSTWARIDRTPVIVGVSGESHPDARRFPQVYDNLYDSRFDWSGAKLFRLDHRKVWMSIAGVTCQPPYWTRELFGHRQFMCGGDYL